LIDCEVHALVHNCYFQTLNLFKKVPYVQVGRFIQQVTCFLGGMVIAFAKGWQLASLMMLMVPALVSSATITHSVILKMASQGQAAYTDAAAVVDQTLGSIRTVNSRPSFSLIFNICKGLRENNYKIILEKDVIIFFVTDLSSTYMLLPCM
jgi:ABC-type multidrug transport system fused ATPase/permease subunit